VRHCSWIEAQRGNVPSACFARPGGEDVQSVFGDQEPCAIRIDVTCQMLDGELSAREYVLNADCERHVTDDRYPALLGRFLMARYTSASR
jgi:hypothetical protein